MPDQAGHDKSWRLGAFFWIKKQGAGTDFSIIKMVV